MKATAAIMRRMSTHNTLLCCGLDPDMSKMPRAVTAARRTPEEQVLEFMCTAVDQTAAHVCAYKIQKAFFDLLSGGHEVLRCVIEHIHEQYAGIPVIVDCKIGDIDNTMTAYIANIFDLLKADGVVVNPYMGDDVLQPLAQLPDKAIVVLVKTSNPNGVIVQDVNLANGQMLWQYILDLMLSRWNTSGNMIPVLSSTASMALSTIRPLIPQQTPILLAGVGAQGGSLTGLADLLNNQGVGPFVNSSRGILYPPYSEDWAQDIQNAAIALKEALNRERKHA